MNKHYEEAQLKQCCNELNVQHVASAIVRKSFHPHTSIDAKNIFAFLFMLLFTFHFWTLLFKKNAF